MNCRQCISSRSAYLDNRLEPEYRELVDVHRASCERCAKDYRMLGRALGALANEGPAQPSANLAARATRAALAAPVGPSLVSFLDKWIPIAWPTAVMTSVTAVVLSVALVRAGDPNVASSIESEDPIALVSAEPDEPDGDDVVSILAIEGD